MKLTLKKLFPVLLLVTLLVSSAVLPASAGAAEDTEHGIVYWMWLDAADCNNCKSGGEPLNQTTLDFAEIDGESGVKMTYAPNGAAFDPYYSLVHRNPGRYKYAVMRYYFETPDDRDAGGNLFIQYGSNGGGQIWKSFDYETNIWANLYFDFSTGRTWSDDDAQISWIRIGHKVQEGEALYVSYLAFFETMEEAEAFDGLADLSSYNDTVKMAKSLDKSLYTNYDTVEKALKVDVSGCFFRSEQDAINAAERGILEAVAKLELIPEEHGEPRQPSAEVLELVTQPATEAPTEPMTQAEGSTAEPDTAGTEAGTEKAASGCSGVMLLSGTAAALCAAAYLMMKRRTHA